MCGSERHVIILGAFCWRRSQKKVTSAEQSAVQSRAEKGRAEQKKNKSAISKFVNIVCSSALVFWISFWIDQSRALCF